MVELDFLIDFPLPRLRFRLARLGSTRTRSELEDTGFLLDIDFCLSPETRNSRPETNAKALSASCAGRVAAAQQDSAARHRIFDFQNMIG
jgi:hypothetical protein